MGVGCWGAGSGGEGGGGVWKAPTTLQQIHIPKKGLNHGCLLENHVLLAGGISVSLSLRILLFSFGFRLPKTA